MKKEIGFIVTLLLIALTIIINREEITIREVFSDAHEQSIAECQGDISERDIFADKPDGYIDVRGGIKIFIFDSLGCAEAVTVLRGNEQFLILTPKAINLSTLTHETVHLTHDWLGINFPAYTGDISGDFENEIFAYTYASMFEAVLLGISKIK